MSHDNDSNVANHRDKAFELVSNFYSDETKLGIPVAVQKLRESLKAFRLWQDARDIEFLEGVASGFIPSTEVFFHVLQEESLDIYAVATKESQGTLRSAQA